MGCTHFHESMGMSESARTESRMSTKNKDEDSRSSWRMKKRKKKRNQSSGFKKVILPQDS